MNHQSFVSPIVVAAGLAMSLAAQSGRVYGDGTQVASLTFPGSQSRAPALSADELSLIFSNDQAGTYDLYSTTRTAITAPWAPPTLLAGLSSPRDDLMGDLSQDGLELVYVQRQGTRADLLMARRSDVKSPWGAPVQLPAPINGVGISNGFPRLTQDALAMYFPRSQNGGAADVVAVRRTARNQAWGAPARFLPAGRVAGDKVNVMIEGNGHRIWFAAQVANTTTWHYTHRDANGQWIPPNAVPELSVRQGEAVIGKTTRRMLQVQLTPISIFELCAEESTTSITYCVDAEWVGYPCPAPPGTFVYVMEWEYETDTVTTVNSYDWRPIFTHVVWVASLATVANALPVAGFGGAILIDPTNFVTIPGAPPTNGLATLPFRLARNPAYVGLRPVLQAVRFDQAGHGSLSHGAALRIVR